MRSFVVLGTVLLIASSAMAAVDVTLTNRADGMAEVVAGQTIVMDIYIDGLDGNGTTTGYGGAEFYFDTDGVVVPYSPPTDFYTLSYNNFSPLYPGGPVAPPVNPSGWNPSTSVALFPTLGQLSDISDSATAITTLSNDGVFATDGFFCWIEVTLPDVGTDYWITPSGIVGDQNSVGLDVTWNPLHVTPEPASALLVLLGVPFLRRRR